MTSRGSLRAEHLTLRYGTHEVVRDLSLTLPLGQFTAILGPNGCGKSTLLRALARQLTPTQGHVLLEGVALGGMSSKEAARSIGLLQQGAVPPEGLSVEGLVRQGRYPHRGMFDRWSKADQSAVERALHQTGLADHRHRMVSALSGGQQQRCWIAMVLAQDAPLLLLDEPTTWLDLRHQVEVLSLMRGLVDRQSLTVIAILHDLNQAVQYADRIVMMQAGQVIAEGPTTSTLTPELLARVFGVEVDIVADPGSDRPICIPRQGLRS